MIKYHRNKHNYFYSGNGLWVRDFVKKSSSPVDINNLIPASDMPLLLDNENNNHNKMLQRIDTESFTHRKIVIVSDGHNFSARHKLLEKLPQDVTIIGVNGVLSKWDSPKHMHYYVVNNPAAECERLLPGRWRVFPKCIASTRTSPKFIDKFNGFVLLYAPVPSVNYCGNRLEADYLIDDYRNPVCAAVGLSYKFGVQKLLLLCCDSVYAEQKPATLGLPNGFWIYPQQKVAHDLIDGNLYWLKNAGVGVGWCSDGPEYKHGQMIKEEDMVNFFRQPE